ncbi:hypothetical protein Acid345_1634 [Candidatus Koribacter versatilis Ellin345]|uniref:Uncharacterized protein n=1 Tax=Koribacter versatilis (strain Ellin345) TaxID=204669 RepID=Q1IR64_KORVE|nr:hypothetical protein Acid345_1634 [Candidatus Koribacter versatilis Ellin345]
MGNERLRYARDLLQGPANTFLRVQSPILDRRVQFRGTDALLFQQQQAKRQPVMVQRDTPVLLGCEVLEQSSLYTIGGTIPDVIECHRPAPFSKTRSTAASKAASVNGRSEERWFQALYHAAKGDHLQASAKAPTSATRNP